MRAFFGIIRTPFFLLALLGVLGGWAVAGQQGKADDPVKQEKPGTPAPGKTTDSPPAKAPGEKRISFEFRQKPWGNVFEWLTEKTGLPVYSPYIPTGTVNFIPPPGKTYTMPEVIDILNNALIQQKYVIIRLEQAYSVFAADQKFDESYLPRLRPDQLKEHGKTEIVSTVLRLDRLVAEDLAPEVEKMLSPFGRVVAMVRANQLVIRDTVGNLELILDTINAIDKKEGSLADQLVFKCKWIPARIAAKTLREVLGNPKDLLPPVQSPGGFNRFSGGTGGIQDMRTPIVAQQQPAQKIRMHYISSDDRLNQVLVYGPTDVLARAKKFLEDLDQPTSRDAKEIAVGAPEWKTYAVPGGNAVELAKALAERYKDSNIIQIHSAGSNTIVVYACPQDQIDIIRFIQGTHETKAEMFPLSRTDASRMVEILKNVNVGDPKAGGASVEADTSQNGVIVRGTPEQIDEVKKVLKALNELGEGALGNLTIINIDRGNSAAIAKELERLFRESGRQNKVNIIGPNEAQPKPESKDKKNGKGKGEEEQEDPPQAQGKEQKSLLVDPQEKKTDQADKQGKPPVTIQVIGNRLIISSEDPKARQMMQELYRLITQPHAGEGDFEVIKLRFANAVDLAKTLDELYNGPKQQTNPIQNFFGGGRFGQPPPAPTSSSTSKAGEVRIVADPATNSLLVRASPAIMLSIRHLLETTLDVAEKDSAGLIKTRVIGPLHYTTATEVANVIRDVYKEQMGQNPLSTTVGGVSGFGGPFGGGRTSRTLTALAAAANPQHSTLAIGVDDRTNSLVVASSEPLYKEILELTNELDGLAKSSTRTVKVVSIRNVDPLLVQQAIDAMQGQRTGGQQSQFGRTGFTPFGGSSGFSPFGSSGFSPFGGSRFGGMSPFGGSSRFGGSPYGGGGGGTFPGRAAPEIEQGGPDFFEQRVTDDPQASQSSLLFDPQAGHWSHNLADGGLRKPTTQEAKSVQLVRHEPQAPGAGQPAPVPLPGGGEAIRGPRSNVTAEPLEQLGVIIVSGNNAADVEEVLRIIRYIEQLGKEAEVRFKLVPLEHADATSVANTLTTLYSRVRVGASGNYFQGAAGPVTQPITPFGQQAGGAAAQGQSSVILLPQVRFNAILVGAPNSRMRDVEADIANLDRENQPQSQPVNIPLKNQPAARVAGLLQNFYTTRYPEGSNNQIRITYNDSGNSLIIQAAPADLDEIRRLVDILENAVPKAVNELRIVPLRYTPSDEMAALLQQTISQGVVTPTTPTTGVATTVGPAGPTAGPTGPLAPRPTTPTAPTPTIPGATPGATGGGATSKTTKIRLVIPRRDGPGVVELDQREDIHITSGTRINALIIEAPPKAMDLILSLVRELDVLPSLRADIKVIPLKRADATAMATMIQQVFLGTGGTTGTTGPTPGTPGTTTPGTGRQAVPSTGGPTTGGPTGTTLPGGVRPGTTPGTTGTPGTPGTGVRPGTTGTGAPTGTGQVGVGAGGLGPTEGTPLIDLRLTVDLRTNSVIVSGSPADVEVIAALISRLDDANVAVRRTEVYHLRNAAAADVATALNNFYTTENSIKTASGTLTAFQIYQQAVAVVAEPVSNKLIISATPEYFDQVMQVIHQIDQEPPQVVVQVLVAEVDLTGTEEFGVEIGLQSPVLFQRSIFPAPQFAATSSTTIAESTTMGTTSLVPPGTSVSSSAPGNPVGQPGFLFNTTAPLGNNVAVNPGIVGYQGIGNLGVGRVSPTSGIGGFVFSAASDSFNLLIRALRTQGRMDILSRPQLQTTDNQAASILIGQYYPYVTTSNITTGIVSNGVNYVPIGIQLRVVPRISPDGKILMRVTPEISSVSATTIMIGGGATATAFNTQTVDTTVLAADGETVAIGGLIVKSDLKSENKIPWLGDLPGVGALFRYRTQQKSKRELLVIMTPHIVRSRFEADAILAAEAHRMDWVLGDVAKVHATTGMEGVLPPPSDPKAPHGAGPALPPVGPVMAVPAPGMSVPNPVMPSVNPALPGQTPAPAMSEPAQETLPVPRTQPGTYPQGQAPMKPATQAAPAAAPQVGQAYPANQPSPWSQSVPPGQPIPLPPTPPADYGRQGNLESPNYPPAGARPLR